MNIQQAAGLVIVSPGLFGAWVTGFLHKLADASCGAISTCVVDGSTKVDLPVSGSVILITRHPSLDILSVVKGGMKCVLIHEDAKDVMAHTLRQTNCTFLEALRPLTAYASVFACAAEAPTALKLRRDQNLRVDEILDLILNHLEMFSWKDSIVSQYEKAITLEDSLSEMTHYSLPGRYDDRLSEHEISVVDQVVCPALFVGLHGLVARWPRDVFLAGDRPNEPAPLITEITGGARFLYYGPYLFLPPGQYQVRFVAGFSVSSVGMPFSAEVVTSRILAKARFEPEASGLFMGEFFVKHESGNECLEIRFRNDEAAIDGQFGLAWAEFSFQSWL